MRKCVLFLGLAALLFLAPDIGATYQDGYTSPAGYVYSASDGYWWKGGYPYTRQWVSSPGYYYCGIYYQGSSYWEYSRAPYTPPAKTTVAYTADWKSKILEVAKERDDHNAYLQSLKVLGLPLPPDQGPVPPGLPFVMNRGGYGGYSLSGYGSSVSLGTYGASGNTLYGYSYNALKDPYGTTDLNALYQQASRLVQGAQGLAGQGHAEFNDLVKQAGSNQARVAEILAKAEAAAKALKAAEGPAVTQEQRSSVSFNVQPTMPPADPPGKVTTQAWKLSAANKCASCHSGAKKEGGLDINTYPSMTPEQKAKVWLRLVTPDKNKRMPKGGDPLPPTEVQEWLKN